MHKTSWMKLPVLVCILFLAGCCGRTSECAPDEKFYFAIIDSENNNLIEMDSIEIIDIYFSFVPSTRLRDLGDCIEAELSFNHVEYELVINNSDKVNLEFVFRENNSECCDNISIAEVYVNGGIINRNSSGCYMILI